LLSLLRSLSLARARALSLSLSLPLCLSPLHSLFLSLSLSLALSLSLSLSSVSFSLSLLNSLSLSLSRARARARVLAVSTDAHRIHLCSFFSPQKTTQVGHYIGAGNARAACSFAILGTLASLFSSLAVAIGLFLLRAKVVHLYTSNNDIADLAQTLFVRLLLCKKRFL